MAKTKTNPEGAAITATTSTDAQEATQDAQESITIDVSPVMAEAIANALATEPEPTPDAPQELDPVEPPVNVWDKLTTEIHDNAIAHGWWGGSRSDAEVFALIHSELSEALEEYREGNPLLYFCKVEDDENGVAVARRVPFEGLPELPKLPEPYTKPEGLAVELADTVIRILDYFGSTHFEPGRFLERESAKLSAKELPELIAELHFKVAFAYNDKTPRNGHLLITIAEINEWLAERDIDLIEAIRLKHAYNIGREYKHGGKLI